jgi:hypothetical protein
MEEDTDREAAQQEELTCSGVVRWRCASAMQRGGVFSWAFSAFNTANGVEDGASWPLMICCWVP